MQLTLHADYSLRVLLYLAHHPDRVVSTQEVSDAYGISRHHLVRVMQTLHHGGYIELHAGRTGGASLARAPEAISLGEVVRCAEPGFPIVECFDPERNTCPITAACRLKSVLYDALQAFFNVLDGYTLKDLVQQPQRFQELLYQVQSAGR